jgi:hypothetical protein
MTINSKKKPNKWLTLINIPTQMGIIIFIFHKIGVWLDENHTSKDIYYFKLLTIIGVFISLFNVYRQVNQISKDQ